MSTNDKIKQVLALKQLSPSQLADEIGVQRSSISHILSGRNRPSLDVIQKIVRRYNDLTYEWFLDEADLQSSIAAQSISQRPETKSPTPASAGRSLRTAQGGTSQSVVNPTPHHLDLIDNNRTTIPKQVVSNWEEIGVELPQIDRILIFYSNGTFKEYKPA
jgi:transcriptional regulator with XRE-family HTH domain